MRTIVITASVASECQNKIDVNRGSTYSLVHENRQEVKEKQS